MSKTRMFRYIRLEEAFRLIDDNIKRVLPIEEVSLSEAYGRFLAEDVISKIDLPLRDMAHFDGYALRSIDVALASPKNPIRLRIKAKVYPSTSEIEVVNPGEAVYVTTGSQVPLNADGILPVEASIVRGEYLEVKYAVKPGEHIIKAGSDVKRGELILRKGHRLRAQDLALLALIGYGKVKVRSKPKVGIIPVGDELTDEYGEARPGKIPCGHVLMVKSFVMRDGGIPLYLGIVPDEIDAIAEAIDKAADFCDIILTISGASKGEKDHVGSAIDIIGEAKLIFHGIMTRPGRQTGFAMVKDKSMIMLPGLSHSTIVGYHLIARRVMYKLMGSTLDEKPLKAILASDLKLPPPKGFKRIIFMRIEEQEECYIAWPMRGESALLSIPVKAYGYAIFNEGIEDVKEGSIINVYPLY